MKCIKIILLGLLMHAQMYAMVAYFNKINGKKLENKIKILTLIGKKNSQKYNRMLFDASKFGDLNKVQEALKNKAHIEAKAKHQCTSLIIAAANGYTEIIKVLLAAGADKNAKNQYQHTALHLAAHQGHNETVKTLLQAGANKDAKGYCHNTALHFAAVNGHTETVRSLLGVSVEIDTKNKRNETALHLAAYHGNEEMVKLLLSCGADTNIATPLGQPIINWFVIDNKLSLIPLILEYGASIARPFPYEEEIEAIIQILNLHASSNCLTISTLLNNNVHVKHILKSECLKPEEINKQDSKNMTALMWAAARGSENIVKALLNYGKKNNYIVDALLTNDKEQTALELAQKHKHIKIAKYIYRYLKPTKEHLEQLITQVIDDFKDPAAIIVQYCYGGL